MSVKPRRVARATRASAVDRAPPGEFEGDLPALTLIGDFPRQVTVVPRALCSLIMSLGWVEEPTRRTVLVPNIEIKFAGVRQGDLDPERGDDQDLEELFSRILPLENALWLLSDMAGDIRQATLRLRSVAAGPEVLEGTRIRLARDYAEELRQQAELMVALLDDMTTGPHANAEPPTDRDGGDDQKKRRRASPAG